VKFVALILACLLFWGCNTQLQQVRKLDALTLEQPVEFARLSNLINPCFTGKPKSDTVSKTDTVQIAGAVTTNTVFVKGNGDTVVKTVTITTPGKVINHSITVTDTIPDNRALSVVNNALKVKTDSLTVVKTQQSSTSHNLGIWRLIALCSLGVIIIFIVAKIVLLFSTGGASTLISKI
jgi:hypothetical protein